MNPKPFIFSGIIAIASLIATDASSQSVTSCDQGISTHNYKHANKAAMARQAGSEGLVVPVSGVMTIESSLWHSDRTPVNPTPKYAASTYSFIIQTRQEKQKVNINPLISNRNYKTGNPAPAKPKQEEWVSQSI